MKTNRFFKYTLYEKPFTLLLFFVLIVFNLITFITPLIYVLIKSFQSNDNSLLFNYSTILNDKYLWISLGNSVLYSTLSVLFQITLGIVSAWVIQYYWRYKISVLLMVIFFMPYSVPSAVGILGWKFLINEKGIISQIISSLFHAPGNYLFTDGAFFTLLIISIWQFYPFVFISVTAKLRKFPPGLINNSLLDTKNEWQRFRYIIFPALKPVIISVTILRLIFMFTKFDTPYLLFGENNYSSVNLLPLYINKQIPMIYADTFAALASSVIMILVILLSYMTYNKIFKARINV